MKKNILYQVKKTIQIKLTIPFYLKRAHILGLSTLREWASKFHIEQGILLSILNIMKHKSK